MGKFCHLLLALVLLLLAAPALAAPCGGDFNAFLAAIARDAQGQGVSRAVIDQAFAGLTPDPAVLAFDRRQSGMFHAKSFEEYAATRVIPARISRARKLMQVHAVLLGRIEQQFGVPGPVIVAVWTLESDNGTGDMGKLPVIRTVATMCWPRPPICSRPMAGGPGRRLPRGRRISRWRCVSGITPRSTARPSC